MNNIQDSEQNLENLLKQHRISQRTYDKVTIMKRYIERKYNLKSMKNSEWNDIIEKINNLNISDKEKEKFKKEIYDQEVSKFRKQREKQTIRDYESLAIIGRGAFGEVHVCKEKKTGKIVAIKKIRKDVLIEKNQIIHVRNEQLLMSKVKSPWIVELKASFQEDDFLYLVMEYLPGGDLMNLLIKKDILSEAEAKFYIAELILAIESIHKLDCIHRDIKPDNVLIDKTGHIKLSDFGLAKVSDRLYENNIDENFNENKFTHHKKNFSCVGTAYYVAPEVLNKKGYGPEIDWWSVGVIFFEMLVGYAPFCSKETSEVCYKILNWQKYLKIPSKITLSKNAEDLIKKMINNSNTRLGKNGVNEIKKHPFFKDINWDKLRETKAPFIPELKNDYDTSYFETFDIKEPFYPPMKRHKKRKDIEYIGYTYKDENDDMLDLKDEYKQIIENLNINNYKDLPEQHISNVTHSTKTTSNQSDINQKNYENNTISKTIPNNNNVNNNNNNVNNLNNKKIIVNSNNNNVIKINKNNEITINNNNNKLQVINLPSKKIKIDYNNKKKNLVGNTVYMKSLKNNNILFTNISLNKPLRLSPSPNRGILLKNFEKNGKNIIYKNKGGNSLSKLKKSTSLNSVKKNGQSINNNINNNAFSTKIKKN